MGLSEIGGGGGGGGGGHQLHYDYDHREFCIFATSSWKLDFNELCFKKNVRNPLKPFSNQFLYISLCMSMSLSHIII